MGVPNLLNPNGYRIGRGALLRGGPTIAVRGRLVIGDDFHFNSFPAPSHIAVDPGASMVIGSRVTISYGAAIYCGTNVTIGDGTTIGPYAVIHDSDFHAVGDRAAKADEAPIAIGENVRIGARVTIMRGTELEDGVTVLSGSVVSGLVRAGLTIGGVPARPLVESGQTSSAEAVIQRVLGLKAQPDSWVSRDEIPSWDSLASLRMLLALEDEFGVIIDGKSMANAMTVGDVAQLVSQARG